MMFSCTNLFNKNKEELEFSYKDNFNERYWKADSQTEFIVIAIHGYNDYSYSFEYPASVFKKFGIDTFSFDLRGFGENIDRGNWFPLEVHINDIEIFLQKIKFQNPKKKIFLLGESMGGAIVVSMVNQKKIPIDGVILVAPAIWDFTKKNFFKSTLLNLFSKIFPNQTLSGDGIINVKPSNNIEMLKQFSSDSNVIHKPTLKSLNGIIKLMDKSFIEALTYLKNPRYETLIILPMKDEIVPRKPLLSILRTKEVKKNVGKKIQIGVYPNNYHMILRDLEGDEISREIKEWLTNRENIKNLDSYNNVYEKINSSDFFHQLD